MRVRIVKVLTGDLDGLPLERFESGKVYDVSPSLGTFLLVSNSAVPVIDDAPALIVPLESLPKKKGGVARKKR